MMDYYFTVMAWAMVDVFLHLKSDIIPIKNTQHEEIDTKETVDIII